MNKRITSLIVAVVLCLGLLVTAVPAFADGEPTMKAAVSTVSGATTAHPGDVVDFKVSIGAISGLEGLWLRLDTIPAGLTYVNGSGKEADNILTTLGATSAAYTDSTKTFLADPIYTGTSDLTLFTFQCKVDEDAVPGKYTLTLQPDTLGNNYAGDYDVILDIVPFELTVEALPVPATGLTVTPSSVELLSNATATLTATVSPSNSTDKVTWTSGNTSVVTVSDTGVLTPVSLGTATITAKAGSKTATVSVTVKCAHDGAFTDVPAKESTCKEQGSDAYKSCSKCGALFTPDGKSLSEIPVRPLADHDYGTYDEEKAATHTADGVKGHYTCSVCGKYFDSSKNELTSLVIEKDPNHGTPDTAWQKDAANHWHLCKVDGCDVVIESTKAEHTFEWKVDKAATEDAAGLKHEECTVCGCKRSENTVIDKLDHTHVLAHTAAAAATCKDTGNIEYWKCTKCGKFYSDEAAANEITEAQTVTAKDLTNHVGETELKGAMDATCTEEGYTGDLVCKSCGNTIETGKKTDKLPHTPATEWKSDAEAHWHECSVVGCGVVIDDTKAAHTFEWKTDKAATEEETGLKHEECSVCGYKRNENTVIDKLDHTHELTHTAAAAATCKDEGNVEYWYCEKCEKFFSDAEAANEITEAQTVTEIDPSNHTGETEVKGAKAASCTEEGCTGDTYCKSCGVKLSEGEKIDAKGHTFKDGKCTVCGTADPDYKPEDPAPETGDSLVLCVVMMLSLGGLAIAAAKHAKKAD